MNETSRPPTCTTARVGIPVSDDGVAAAYLTWLAEATGYEASRVEYLVGAHLDKSGTEVVVPDVEVVAGDPTVGLGEGERRRPAVAAGTLGCGEHRRELLRHADRCHLRPVAAARTRYRRITSTFRSRLANRTTGMWLASAYDATARRNRPPIRSKIAGDGIGNPRCRVMNSTTCPGTCRFGTYPFR